jgi:hypothetical protein
MVLTELEEICSGFALGHRKSSLMENFNWLPFTPPLIAFSGPSETMHKMLQDIASGFDNSGLDMASCLY